MDLFECDHRSLTLQNLIAHCHDGTGRTVFLTAPTENRNTALLRKFSKSSSGGSRAALTARCTGAGQGVPPAALARLVDGVCLNGADARRVAELLRAGHVAPVHITGGQPALHTPGTLADAEQLLAGTALSAATCGPLAVPVWTLVHADRLAGAEGRSGRFLKTPDTCGAAGWRATLTWASACVAVRLGDLPGAEQYAPGTTVHLPAPARDVRTLPVPRRADTARAWLPSTDPCNARQLAEKLLPLVPAQAPGLRGAAQRPPAPARASRERVRLIDGSAMLLQRPERPEEPAKPLVGPGRAVQVGKDSARQQAVVRRTLYLTTNGRTKDPQGTAPVDVPREPTPPQRPDTGEDKLAHLSLAERRVGELAALGRTNREISSRLCITISTVEQHLTRVYRKLNIHRRQDLPAGLRNRAAASERATVRRVRHLTPEYPTPEYPTKNARSTAPVDVPRGPTPPQRPDTGEDELAHLSLAERRVGELAALGRTNREISSRLCITISTVEQHLTRVYRKLNIHRRQDLPAGLRNRAATSEAARQGTGHTPPARRHAERERQTAAVRHPLPG